MLTRSHSNTEVKGEICFHIKIYLSYDFFQKSSCWLRNISLKVTRMRETFNSWNNYFQNFKASEAYYEEGCYFSILSRAWYKRKSPVFRIEPQNFGFAIQQEGLGRNQRLDSTWELRIFSLFHARDKKKKKTICLTHQQAQKFTKFLILVPSYYSYEELRRRQVLLTIFNDCAKKNYADDDDNRVN